MDKTLMNILTYLKLVKGFIKNHKLHSVNNSNNNTNNPFNLHKLLNYLETNLLQAKICPINIINILELTTLINNLKIKFLSKVAES